MEDQQQPVAILCARADSVYFELGGCAVFDEARDARSFSGGCPVVAHPPCRAWGRLRKFAVPAYGEMDLARLCVARVRREGGVLEHPAGSKLFADQRMPAPGGDRDAFGGWTLPVLQSCFGHRAAKATWLYIVGVAPAALPAMPFQLGEATHVIGAQGRRADGSRLRKGDAGWRPEVTRREREATPEALARWLVAVARLAA